MFFRVFFLLSIYASAAGSQDFGFVCGFESSREEGATVRFHDLDLSFYRSGTVRPLILFGKLNTLDDPFSLTQLKDRNGNATQSSANLLNPDYVGSLAHYFKEMSYGALTLEDNDDGVEGMWFKANRTEASGYDGDCLAKSREFATEVFADADDTVDFSDYDRNGDGVVDLVILYIPKEFRDAGCNFSGVVYTQSGFMYETEDSVSINDNIIYVIQRPSFPWLVGVTAHEYGHVMHLPDLDDGDGDSAGIGLWGLMGLGPLGWSWSFGNDLLSNRNNDLYSGPTPLSVWSRYKVGWITEANGRLEAVESDTEDAATLHDIHSQSSTVKAYKIPVRGSDTEYFLVANRQNTHTEHSRGSYYDDSAPASGLAIWHIDDGLPFVNDELRFDQRNNNEKHKRVDLECADGLYDNGGFGTSGNSENSISGGDNLDYLLVETIYTNNNGNMGDATDLWDGSTDYRHFTPLSNPSTAGYSNDDTPDDYTDDQQAEFSGIAIRNITQNTNGSVSVDIRFIPSAPGLGVVAHEGTTLVTLGWTEPMVNATAISEYQYSIDETNWTNVDGGANARSVLFDNSTSTTFWVRAVTANENGETAKIDLDRPGTVTLRSNHTLGTPTVGDVLTADLTDANGGIRRQRWQWERGTVSGGVWTGTSITHATDARYMLTTADVGQQVRATVSYLDGAGDNTDTAASEPTAVVVGRPGVPRALEAVPGDGQVTLTWQAPLSDGGSPITRYEHRQSDDGGTTWQPNWTAIGVTLRRRVGDLTNGTAYTFEVRAVNGVGAGDSTRVTATPLSLSLPPPPSLPRPTGLMAQAVGNGQVKLTWNDPGIAVEQWLYGVKEGTGSFVWKPVPASDATTTTTTYTVENLTNGVEYRFKVRIKNDEVVSPASAVAVATPVAICRVELSGLSAVSFAEHGSGAVATYTATATDCGALEWSLGGTDARAFRLDGSGLTRPLHFNTPPNFEVKQTYAVNIRVSDGTETGSGSDRVSVTVSVTNVEEAGTITLSSTQPRVGEAITATLSDPDGSVANLRWSWLYFRDGTSTEEEAVSGTNGSLSATFRPSSVLVGIRLRARALYGDGHGPNKSAQSVQTDPVVDVPDAPGSLSASPGDGQVVLSWSAADANGSSILRYEYRYNSGGWTSVSGGAAARRQLVTGLTNGTAYTFEVRAVNAVGAGDSGRVTETPFPLSLPPPRPTGLMAQAVGSGQVKLTWNNPGIAVEQWLYGVKEGTGSFAWKPVPHSDATTTTYTVENLTNGVEYRFKVRMENAEGVSQPSEVAVATPVAVCRVELSGLSAVSFAEHGSGAVATYTATATDCGALEWSLGGTDARAFRLDGSGLTRTLHFNSPPNFEVKQTYAVNIRVSDGTETGSGSAVVSVTVSVTNVEEAGTITLSSTQPRVGEAITATLSDPDGAVTNLRWSWLYRRDGTSTEEEAVSGANGSLSATFRPSSVLVGIRLQARALYGDGHGPNKSAQSVQTDPVVDVPDAPGSLSASPGDGQVVLSWSAADANGSSILRYEYSYRSGNWTPVSGGAAARRQLVTGLTNGTAYTFEVRAVNAVGAGTASQATATPNQPNRAPTITSGPTQVSFAENGSGTVATYTASDPDGDAISWSKTGADASAFRLSSSGVLTFQSTPNYEAKSTYQVDVKASDGTLEAVRSVTVTITNVNEPPPSPAAPTVRAAATNGHKRLAVNWTAPSTTGRPSITDYDVRYQRSTATNWTPHSVSGTGTATTITGLSPSTSYRVQVRATNNEGTSGWSASGSGSTGAAPNRAPVISGPASVSVPENTTSVADYDATDPDGDAITWSKSGTHSSKFALSSRGTLTFSSVPNFESGLTTYSVTVTATDAGGLSDSQAVTVTITNVEEAGSVRLSSTQPRVGEAITATLSDPDGSMQNVRWGWLYFRARDAEGAVEESSEEAAIEVNNGLPATTLTPSQVLAGRRLRARVLYADGHGPNKEAQSVTTAPVIGRPGRPGNLSARPGNIYTRVDLSWTAAVANGSPITDYQYRYRKSGTSSWSGWSGVGVVTSYTVSGLSSGASYAFEVRAVNAVGAGSAAQTTGTVRAQDEDDQGKDDPAEDAQDEEAPTEDAQGEDDPAEDAQTEDDPAEDAQTEDDPAEDAQDEDDPAEDAQGEEAQTEEAQTEDAQGEDDQGKDDQAEEAQSEDDQTAAKPVSLTIPSHAMLAALAVPNPFNPHTSLHIQLPASSPVRLTIYNVAGQMVRTLVESVLEAGYHTFHWDGRDQQGHPVTSGVYLYRVRTTEQVLVGKMALIR